MESSGLRPGARFSPKAALSGSGRSASPAWTYAAMAPLTRARGADRVDRMGVYKVSEMSLLNWIGATRPGTWAIAHVVSPLQRRLLVATRGRVSLTGKLPVLLLTATGRRSARPRTIPLIFLRDGDELVVCNVRPLGNARTRGPST